MFLQRKSILCHPLHSLGFRSALYTTVGIKAYFTSQAASSLQQMSEPSFELCSASDISNFVTNENF
ncbi:branched-chain-amino-acid transaminase [Ranunculus cassubicifolius]